MISKDTYKAFDCCSNPRRILNKYTNELLQIDCGVCPYCLLKRYGSLSLSCTSHALSNHYCYFITLTYSNRNLPKMRCFLVDRDYDWFYDEYGRFYSSTRVDYIPLSCVPDSDEQREFLFCLNSEDSFEFSIQSSATYLKKLQRKTSLPCGSFGYLRYRDVQLFLKRLRKKIYKDYGEKVTFFCAGEYGPKTFRPHFHVLLYSNGRAVLPNYPRLIHEVWSLGRTDSQLSRGSAGSYTAGYVNSVVSLPYIFKANSHVRPRCRRSQYFAQGLYSQPCETVQEEISRAINGVSFSIDGTLLQFRPSRSYLNRLFPRFGCISPSDIHSLTGLFQVFRAEVRNLQKFVSGWDLKSPLAFAKAYLDRISSPCYGYDSSLLRFILRVAKGRCTFSPKAFGAVYRFFLKVDHFFKAWKIGSLYDFPDIQSIIRVLGYVRDYYNQFEMKRLNDYYRSCESFQFEVLPQNPDSAVMLKNGFVSDSMVQELSLSLVTSCSFFKNCQVNSSFMISKKQKHKEINDANGYFVYNTY